MALAMTEVRSTETVTDAQSVEVPQGRMTVAQDFSPGNAYARGAHHRVPQGRMRVAQDFSPGNAPREIAESRRDGTLVAQHGSAGKA